jgi:hypothetical protein
LFEGASFLTAVRKIEILYDSLSVKQLEQLEKLEQRALVPGWLTASRDRAGELPTTDMAAPTSLFSC